MIGINSNSHFRNALILLGAFLFSSIAIAQINPPEGIQVYQKNIHLTPERLAHDIYQYRNANDIWEILRQEFSLDHYEDNPVVQQKIDWFLHHQDYLQRSVTRAAPYLYFILQQVRKRNLPAELVLLPIVESAYNPFAYSTAGAAGIWQMMPGTASGYGIRQNGWYDGRRDVIASTKAALNHLAYLQTFFEGNWLLAIAAYDTGEGNVNSAIRKNIRIGENTDYWSLPLAQETKDYIPQLLALAIIISHPEQYSINLPPVQNAPYLAQIDVGSRMDLRRAAYFAGLDEKKVKELNSGYGKSGMDPFGPFKIVIPIENVERFTINLARSSLYSHHINWITYKVRSGDTLPKIAKRFKTSPATLKLINKHLASNLKPGNRIVIPRSYSTSGKYYIHGKKIITQDSFTGVEKTVYSPVKHEFVPRTYKVQPKDTLYMVRQDDTLKNISDRFKVSPHALFTANTSLTKKRIHIGDRLIIPTHLNQKVVILKPGSTLYMVRHKDTLAKIAKKFHINTNAIRVANGKSHLSLFVGQRLIIPTSI